MANIESMIGWFREREGKVTYSMTNRLGPSSYDCSSAVFFSLIAAEFLPSGTPIGSTESLYALEGTLLLPISRAEVKRGDIFVSGTKGASGGANGHTGVFLSNSQIIHCTSSKNTIAETAASGWMGGPPTYYYRLKGAEAPIDPEPTIKEDEEIMFIYWERRSDGNGSNAFGVFGNTRTNLSRQDIIDLQNISRDTTGREIKAYEWGYQSSTVKLIERLTEKK